MAAPTPRFPYSLSWTAVLAGTEWTVTITIEDQRNTLIETSTILFPSDRPAIELLQALATRLRMRVLADYAMTDFPAQGVMEMDVGDVVGIAMKTKP